MTLFSVPALLIMFREALEAAVVVSVLLQMVEKMGMRQLKKHVWIGALTGLAISIVVGVVFIICFYVLGSKVFTGNSQNIFKGVVSWLASLLITMVAFHMLKFYNMERKWKRKLSDAAASRDVAHTIKSYRWTILLLALSATLREGIESVLFLTGVSQGDGVKSIIIPGIVGVVLGLAVGMLIFYTGRSIRSLKWFFILSAGLLLFIAAGMVSQGVVYFTDSGLFGTLFPYEDRAWYNHILWDTSGCCNMYTNDFWSIIRALFGYTDQPTGLNLMYYLLYWAVTLAAMAWKWYTGTLTDRRAAQIDDLKSFAHHLGEQLDEDAGLKRKGSGSSGGVGAGLGSELDLEAGEGEGEGKAEGKRAGLHKVESAFVASGSPRRGSADAGSSSQGGAATPPGEPEPALPRSSPGGDSAGSFGAQQAPAPPPPAAAV